MTAAFTQWLNHTLPRVDRLICNSRSTREDLEQYVERARLTQRPTTHWLHLGCDLESGRTVPPSAKGTAVVDSLGSSPFAVVVGTVEPRKDHATIVDAFERLWALGGAGALVMVGKAGWNVEKLVARLRSHPEKGRRLFWLEEASDGDIALLLEHAHCLIQASIAEGFGLPLVEAGSQGIPLVASDLPVFREIVGDSARWFRPGDAAALANVLDATFHAPVPERLPPLKTQTWRESTAQLLSLLTDRPTAPKENP